MRSGWFGNRLTAAFATVFGLSLALAANSLSAARSAISIKSIPISIAMIS